MLITYGALLGKTSPLQLLLIAVAEMCIFTLNEEIGIEMDVADVGGSMVVHTFGAYFGLAASWILTPASAKDVSAPSV